MDDPSGSAQRDELPTACTLGASDGPARLQCWQQLHQIAAPTARLTNGQLEVRYQTGPEVLAKLQDLVAEERVCCAFVSWAVTEDSGQPVLRVTAPPGSPEDIEPIAAMFVATDWSRTWSQTSIVITVAVEAWNGNQTELIEFVRARGLGVIASSGPDGSPQAALVGIAATDHGELVLDCWGSRKYANIERDPSIALVVGWDDKVTAEVEGRGDVLSGVDLERCKAAYFEQYPDGQDPADSPEIAHIRVTAMAALLGLPARHVRELRDRLLTAP